MWSPSSMMENSQRRFAPVRDHFTGIRSLIWWSWQESWTQQEPLNICGSSQRNSDVSSTRSSVLLVYFAAIFLFVPLFDSCRCRDVPCNGESVSVVSSTDWRKTGIPIHSLSDDAHLGRVLDRPRDTGDVDRI